MDFDVRKTDADALAAWVKSFAVGAQRKLEMIASCGSSLGRLEGFSGAAADSSRAYWEEVHAPVLSGLDAALRELYARYGEYSASLDGVDAARDARFGSGALSAAEADLGPLARDVSERSASLAAALEDVSDIIELAAPAEADLGAALFDLADLPRAHREAVGGVEDYYARSAAGLDALASQLSLAVGYAGSAGSPPSYSPGSAPSLPWAGGLADAAVASRAFSAERLESAHSAYTAVANREQHRLDEALDARVDHGQASKIAGAATLISGIAAILFSAGSAAPFVIPVMAFGSAQLIEGSQDVEYGLGGDLDSVSWNPIRDTLFLGNQAVYDGFYIATDVISVVGAPANSAFDAAKATGLSGFGSLPVFTKSFTGDMVKDTANDIVVGLTFSSFVDPEIDRYYAGKEAGEALKSGGREVFGSVTSGMGDVWSPSIQANASSPTGGPKVMGVSSSNVSKADGSH